MKCAKCGAELKKGCLYCSVCGHEAQIVSDYNVLEDDYLRSLLKDGESAKEKKQPSAADSLLLLYSDRCGSWCCCKTLYR